MEKPRLARLTAILTQLQSKRLLTARELAEKHEVSIRTIYRDIRTLEQSGVPVYTEEGRGYSLMEGYQLPPIMFTEAEANALVTAAQLISKNTDKSLTDQYQGAIEKIKAVLQISQKDKTEFLSERMEIREQQQRDTSSTYLIQLQTTITNFQLVRIAYTSVQQKSSQRDIEPFALIHTQEGNWVLIAFCRLRKDFRAFRLDRIQELTILSMAFEPHDISLQQYFEQARTQWEKQLDNTPDMPLTRASLTFASNQKIQLMQNVQITPFQIIGIAVRTSNASGTAAQDIGGLWAKFMGEGIAAKIPNKLDERIFAIYTNYEGDHNKPYDMILGCSVSSLEQLPAGMVGHRIAGGSYEQFVAEGDLTQGAVFYTWTNIWEQDLKRTYQADFEIYDERSQNPKAAVVDIFIGVVA